MVWETICKGPWRSKDFQEFGVSVQTFKRKHFDMKWTPRIVIVSPNLYCWVKELLHKKPEDNTMRIKTTKAQCPQQPVHNPYSFATERWLISRERCQDLPMSEAGGGLCLCKSEDLQGSSNSVWLLWLLKLNFSIFVSYLWSNSWGTHLNREPVSKIWGG